jgi:polyphenol oxidase
VLVVDLGPGVRAGFTTRATGNLGLGVGDDPGDVRRRRRAVAAWAGGSLAWSTQVHGTAVAVVTDARDAPDDDRPAGDTVGEADAIVAVGRGDGSVGAAVVVADCVPVLLADPVAGVAGAVHAGRRGLADGVVQAAVAELVRHGADPGRLRAVVGPAICGRCYEVPADLRDEVAGVVPAVAGTTSWGTASLDLPRGVAAVLQHVGVAHVHATGICPYTDHRLFSHRRSTAMGEAEGRFAGIVRIVGL